LKEGRTVVLPGVASDSQPPSLTILAGGAAREGYRRLALLAALFAGGGTAGMGFWLLQYLVTANMPVPVVQSAWNIGYLATGIAISLAVLVGAWRGLFPPRAFAPIALTYVIVISVVLGAAIMGWQFRLGSDALRWAQQGGERPWWSGAGEIPVVALWLVFFAMLIPLRPRQVLLGAGVSALTLFAWPSVSVAVLGMPAELEPARGPLLGLITLRLAVATLIGVGMAYFAARAVHSLRRELSEARRMGSYQLREKLGEGGMGEVWTADHQMLARSAAIKLIKSEGDPGTDPGWDGMVRRFEREVRAAARLRSPHTIEIYDYGLADDGSFYYVMELLDGLDLQALVKRYGPAPWERAVYFLRQICHSLGEAHTRDLIHRDIKPANIFACRMGRDADQIKVLDFGLVAHSSPSSQDTRLTQEGSFVGTPSYAAPELAAGSADSADARSDIYSLGCVAFWLLTGSQVFQAQTAVEMLIKHARDAPKPPSSCTELEIPAGLDELVMACLAKDPASRPASTDDLDARLAALDAVGRWTQRDAREWWDRHRPVESRDAA
jgi:hypothetical protein